MGCWLELENEKDWAPRSKRTSTSINNTYASRSTTSASTTAQLSQSFCPFFHRRSLLPSWRSIVNILIDLIFKVVHFIRIPCLLQLPRITRYVGQLHTLQLGCLVEEWFRKEAVVNGDGTLSAELPSGTTHYLFNLIDENNFLVTYPEIDDMSTARKKKKKASSYAISVQ